MRTTNRFDVVKITATFKWTDRAGKRRQRSKQFMQTINPYNRDSDGNVKTRGVILKELEGAAKLWTLRQENEERDPSQGPA